MIDKIKALEEGALNPEQTVALFQTLLDTGTIRELDVSYVLYMGSLIAEGFVTLSGNKKVRRACIKRSKKLKFGTIR